MCLLILSTQKQNLKYYYQFLHLDKRNQYSRGFGLSGLVPAPGSKLVIYKYLAILSDLCGMEMPFPDLLL
jgi:hypothetical protein